MRDRSNKSPVNELPTCIGEFVGRVTKRMRYRRKVRQEVQAELTAHFEDELRDVIDPAERERRARGLIEEFGDPTLLGVLCRRAKKRCRPLWKKALVRCVQVFGVVVLYVGACMAPLYLGRTTIRMDYLTWLNETVRGDREPAGNARPYYDKAVELYVEMPEWLMEEQLTRPADMNEVKRKSLLDWLGRNASALDAVREGSRQPACWNSYRSQPIALPDNLAADSEAVMAGILGDCMPSLSAYRQLAYALQWQVRYEAVHGDPDVALDDCFVLARFGDHLLGHGLAIEQLVGTGIERTANDSLLSLLGHPAMDPNLLAEIQGLWQQRLDRVGSGVNFDTDKGLWLDRIQRSFTDDGKGNGHALARGVAYWMHGYQDFWQALTLRYPTRREAMAEIDAYYSHLQELQATFPWQWQRQDIDTNDPSEAMAESFRLMVQSPRKFRLASLFLRMQSDGDHVLIEAGWRRRTEGIAVTTILAIERYRMKFGQYPVDLEQVVASGYLPQVPRDPFAPGPFSYSRIDGGFTLYSWGDNRKDDGGHRGTEPYTGDRVYWPVGP